MPKIGFIGLGIMGAPMACNLADAGFDVVGFNRSRPRSDAFEQHGVKLVASALEAAAGADVVATMLPDSPDVQAVLGELLRATRPGTLFIDFSTIRPDVAAALHQEAHDLGLGLVDAPVSGGEQGAIDGSLSIMVGGVDADYERAQPVLAAVGKTIVHVGPPGAGQTVKAANQLIVAGTLQLVSEAIVFLEANGADLEAALEVLGGGLAGSAILERKSAGMLKRQFDPGFRLELHHKDLGIFMSSARDLRVATPMGAVAAQLVASMVARGHGGLDHSGLLMLVDELSGRPKARQSE
ncbi:MAG: 2-hydroxy-3-oxopropionate reductase [Marmoricola sp.]|nr:2-hydroxy-3-oxopropionate reductase [Marmoricola sp.]